MSFYLFLFIYLFIYLFISNEEREKCVKFLWKPGTNPSIHIYLFYLFIYLKISIKFL